MMCAAWPIESVGGAPLAMLSARWITPAMWSGPPALPVCGTARSSQTPSRSSATGAATSRMSSAMVPASPISSSCGARLSWAQLFASTLASRPPPKSNMMCQLSGSPRVTVRPAAGPSGTTKLRCACPAIAITRSAGPSSAVSPCSG